MQKNKFFTPRILLMVILFFGILSKLPFFLKNSFAGTIIGTDSAAYLRLAENLFKFNNYSFGENFNYGILFPPGYPIFIGLLNYLIKNLFVSGKTVSLIFSLFTVILLYFFGKKVYDEKAGIIAAFCFVFYPGIVYSSIIVGSEAQFIFFLLLSLYIFICFVEKATLLKTLLFGFSAGFTYLTRPEGIIIIVLPLVLLFKRRLCKKKIIVHLSIMIIVAILVSSPYLLFLKKSTGKFILSGKTNFNFVSGLKEIGKNFESIRYSLNENKTKIDIYDQINNFSIIKYFIKYPKSFFIKYLKNLIELFKNLLIFGFPILIPLLISITEKRRFFKFESFLLVGISFFYFVIFPIFFIQRRYIFPIIVPLILLSSSGFIQNKFSLFHKLQRFSFFSRDVRFFLKNNLTKLIILIFIISSLFLNFKLNPIRKEKIPIEHINFGKILKEQCPVYESVNVMSKKPWVSFYADARWTDFPCANSKEIIDFARKYSVDFIVVDERFSSPCNEFSNLFNLDKLNSNVKMVYQVNYGKKMRVFKIIKEN